MQIHVSINFLLLIFLSNNRLKQCNIKLNIYYMLINKKFTKIYKINIMID